MITHFHNTSGERVTARVTQAALFLVEGKGWCAVRPSVAAAKYGIHVFLFLSPGDVCVPVLEREEIVIYTPDTMATRVKRPMNSFMLFAKKYRLELTRQHPGRDNRDISVLLGEKWRSLSSEEKRVYAREAQTLAEVHKRSHPDCWKRKKSK